MRGFVSILLSFWALTAYSAPQYFDVSLVREGKTSKIDYRLTPFAQQLIKSKKGSLQVMVEGEPELKKITRFARAEIRAKQLKILLFANGILIDTPTTPDDPCCDGFWNGFWQGLDDTLHGKTLKEDLGAFASGAVFGPILKSLLNNLPHGKLLALGGVIAFSKDFLESKVTGYQTNQKRWSNSFIWGRVVFDFVKELALVTIGMKSSEGLGKLLAKIAKKNPWAKYLIDFFMEAFTPSPETKAKNEAYLKKQKKTYGDANKDKGDRSGRDGDSDVHVTYPKPSPNPTAPVKPRVPGTPVNVRAPVSATTKPSSGGITTLEQPSAPSPSNPSILNNAAPSTANVQTVGNPHKDFINWRNNMDLDPKYKPTFDRIGEALKNPANLLAPAALGARTRSDFQFLRGVPGLPTSVKTFASSVPPPDDNQPSPKDSTTLLQEALYFGGITPAHINALQTYYNQCRKNAPNDDACLRARNILRDRKMSKYLDEAHDGQRETHHILALNWHYQRCLESNSQSTDCLKTQKIFLELAKTYVFSDDDETSSIGDPELIDNLRRACYFYESLVNIAETNPLLKTALDESLKAIIDHLKHGRGLTWKDTTKNGDLHLIFALYELEYYQTDVEQLPAHLRFPTLWREAFSSAGLLDYFSISFPFKKILAVFNKPLWHLTKYVGAIGFESLYRELVTDIQTRGHWSQEHVMALATLATMPEDDENPVDSLREFATETLRQFGITYERTNSKVRVLNNPTIEAHTVKEARTLFARYQGYERVFKLILHQRGRIPDSTIASAKRVASDLYTDSETMFRTRDRARISYDIYRNNSITLPQEILAASALAELIYRGLPENERNFFPGTQRVETFVADEVTWWIVDYAEQPYVSGVEYLNAPKHVRAYLAVLDCLYTTAFTSDLYPINGSQRFSVTYAPSEPMPLMDWMSTRIKPVYGLEISEFQAALRNVLPILKSSRFLNDLKPFLEYLQLKKFSFSTFMTRIDEIEGWMKHPMDGYGEAPSELELPPSSYDDIADVDQLPEVLRTRLKTPFYFGTRSAVDPALLYQMKAGDAVQKISRMIEALDPRDNLYGAKKLFFDLKQVIEKSKLPFTVLLTNEPLTIAEINSLPLHTLVFTFDKSLSVRDQISSLKAQAERNTRVISNLQNSRFIYDPEVLTVLQSIKEDFFRDVPENDTKLRLAAEITWLEFFRYCYYSRFNPPVIYEVEGEEINPTFAGSFYAVVNEHSQFTPQQKEDAKSRLVDAGLLFKKHFLNYKQRIDAFKKRK